MAPRHDICRYGGPHEPPGSGRRSSWQPCVWQLTIQVTCAPSCDQAREVSDGSLPRVIWMSGCVRGRWGRRARPAIGWHLGAPREEALQAKAPNACAHADGRGGREPTRWNQAGDLTCGSGYHRRVDGVGAARPGTHARPSTCACKRITIHARLVCVIAAPAGDGWRLGQCGAAPRNRGGFAPSSSTSLPGWRGAPGSRCTSARPPGR